MNEEFYISIVGEIFDGYTEFDFYGRSVYLKHLTVKDQRYLHIYYEKYKKSATDRGVETEAEILKKLKEDDLWSDEDDLKIESLRSEIINLKKTRDSLFLNSQKEAINKDILEKESKKNRLLFKRTEVVGKTAESYASNMAATEMIRYFIFDSKELDNHAFTEDEFDELDDLQIIKLHQVQKSVSEKLNELDIQKSVLRPFFGLYLSFCENARDFYGKALVDLSVFQLKLVLFGRIFQSIFQYTEDIPDDIKEDPERLMAFSESKSNKGKGGNKGKFIDDNAAASTVFGATTQDVKDLAEGSGKAVSLSDEIKKAGGKLTMEQMMKLSGQ